MTREFMVKETLTVDAGTTADSTTVTGNFLPAHVGMDVYGTGIPDVNLNTSTTVVVSVVEGVSAVLSRAATATGSPTLTLIRNSFSDGSPVRSFTVTFEDVLAAPGFAAASGTATNGISTMVYTAAASGIAGNLVAVLIGGDTPSATEAVVSGTTITINIGTDPGEDQFARVRNAILANPDATALISVGTVDGGGGTYTDAGDVYLADGASVITLASFEAGARMWDATVWIPVGFDATTLLIPCVGAGAAQLVYAAEPDLTTVDDTGASGVAMTLSTQLFNREARLRLTDDGDLVVRAYCEAGANPSQGEMILDVDVRMPS